MQELLGISVRAGRPFGGVRSGGVPLVAAVLAAVLTACSGGGGAPRAGGSSASSRPSVTPSASSSARPSAPAGWSPSASATTQPPGQVAGTVGPSFTPGKPIDGTPVTGSADDLVLAGAVDSNRMIGLSGADLRGGRKPALRWVSPVFGAVIEAVTDGTHVWALSTNTPDLVRLSLRSTAVEAKNVPMQVGVVSRPQFGALLLDDGLLYLSFDAGSQVTVAAFDPTTLKVVRHKTFADRFTAFPHMCRLDAGHLAVASSSHVDVLDVKTLARTATADLETPNGIACGGGRVYAANYETPTGAILDVAARRVGSFRWKGHGSDALYFDRARKVLYGSDDIGSAVFRCPAAGGSCTSVTVPNKPTSLLVSGDRLLVTVEGAKAVAVLDSTSLKVITSWGVSGIPRTLVAT